MYHILELIHTIMFKDLDKIIESGFEPKKSIKFDTIIIGSAHYFYDTAEEMNQDFESITKYLEKAECEVT